VIIIHWRKALKIFTSNRTLWLFLATYFTIYFHLYFWYAPMVDGNRLILAQFIPLIFILSSNIQELIEGSAFGFIGKRMVENSIGIFTALNPYIGC